MALRALQAAPSLYFYVRISTEPVTQCYIARGTLFLGKLLPAGAFVR